MKFKVTICALFFIGSTLYGDWSSPASITETIPGVPPALAVNASGEAITIFEIVSSSLMQSSSFNGTSWSTAENIAAITFLFVTMIPEVVMNDSGTAIGTWVDLVGGLPTARASVYNGTSWSSAENLGTISTGSPQITINNSGTGIAVWPLVVTGDLTIQASVFDGSSWSSATTLSASGQDANVPQVSINASGNAVAVWQRSNGTNTIIQAATYDGTSWSSPTDLSATGQDAVNSQVGIDSSGNAVAIWQRLNGTNSIIQAATYDGTSWSSPQDLSATGQDASLPEISVNGSGNAAAVWIRSNGTNDIIQASTYDGSSWSSAVNLSASGETSLSARVSINKNGYAVASWNRNNVIQTSVFNRTTWLTPQNISTASSVSSPVVGTATDTAVVAWVDTSGTGLRASQGTSLFFPKTPTNFAGKLVKNKFLTQTDLINKLTWDASDDDTVTGYRIYEAGNLVFETTSITGPFEAVLHNRKNNRTYVYNLVSFNAQGLESSSVSVTI